MTADTETQAATMLECWKAVDEITQAKRRKVQRSNREDADWVADAEGWFARLATDPAVLVCDVSSFRKTAADYQAATAGWSSIPSLWDQAVEALRTGGESDDGRGRSPLRERSVADLDLMETMLTVREFVAAFHRPPKDPRAAVPPVPTDRLPASLRRLASELARYPHRQAEWVPRVIQWARMLAVHLQALEHVARPIRLRNAPCPLCKTRQVTVDVNGQQARKPDPDNRVVPPLLIDFVDGYIRAATCTACSATWWRGAQLYALRDELFPIGDTPDTDAAAEAS